MAFQNPTRPGTIAEMNITPLVDVMLVLLIIFMVAAPLLSRPLALDLPIAGPTPPPPGEAVSLRIDADGGMYWNGVPMPAAAIDAAMRIEAARREPPVLQIDLDADSDYAHLATALGRARHAGLERIALP